MNKMSEIIIRQNAVTSSAPHLHGACNVKQRVKDSANRDARLDASPLLCRVSLSSPKLRPLLPWQQIHKDDRERMYLRLSLEGDEQHGFRRGPVLQLQVE